MVEIPRFKLRELNLGIVSRRGLGMKLAWFGLWAFCTCNALLGLVSDLSFQARDSLNASSSMST